MKDSQIRHRGFTLMETVIAIGVVAVLLTGFMVVFGPAAQGIRKSISSQEADRLVSALEQELTNVRKDEMPNSALTGFDNALLRIKKSTGKISANRDTDGDPSLALLVYQYRGSTASIDGDGTPMPINDIDGLRAGSDYVLVPMMRRRNSQRIQDEVETDLTAIEGQLFLVKCVQMVYRREDGSDPASPVALVALEDNERGKIIDPSLGSDGTDIEPPDGVYPEAVIAFRAEFYQVPAKSKDFVKGPGFEDFYRRATRPTFVRNLAIRR